MCQFYSDSSRFFCNQLYLKWVQVAKTHFYGISHLKLFLNCTYIYGKYSIQTMIFWSLCAFIWFRNIEKMRLQMTSVSLQPVPTLVYLTSSCVNRPFLERVGEFN
jgi:hypothetical protein